jgi:hypothetical protein
MSASATLLTPAAAFARTVAMSLTSDRPAMTPCALAAVAALPTNRVLSLPVCGCLLLSGPDGLITTSHADRYLNFTDRFGLVTAIRGTQRRRGRRVLDHPPSRPNLPHSDSPTSHRREWTNLTCTHKKGHDGVNRYLEREGIATSRTTFAGNATRKYLSNRWTSQY